MGEVNVTINNRSFTLGCDDGEEQHVKILAEHIGKHVANLRHTLGPVGDDQLFLMAGLMVCDELWEARDLLIKTREMLKQQAAQAGPEVKGAEAAKPSDNKPSQSQTAGEPVAKETPASMVSKRDLFTGSGI